MDNNSNATDIIWHYGYCYRFITNAENRYSYNRYSICYIFHHTFIRSDNWISSFAISELISYGKHEHGAFELVGRVLARFISADSVVPGDASGGMDGVALKGL